MFDHAFVVKAWDPLWVSEILRDDAQRELLALKQGADLEVDDHGIQLKDLPLDPDGMTARFDRMAAIAESLGW